MKPQETDPRTSANPVDRLARYWLAWFGVYFATGVWAMMNDQTGYFAETADHVSPLWVKLVFLNLPLQIVLALAAIELNKLPAPGWRRAALVIAAINTLLIMTHIVIAVVVDLA